VGGWQRLVVRPVRQTRRRWVLPVSRAPPTASMCRWASSWLHRPTRQGPRDEAIPDQAAACIRVEPAVSWSRGARAVQPLRRPGPSQRRCVQADARGLGGGSGALVFWKATAAAVESPIAGRGRPDTRQVCIPLRRLSRCLTRNPPSPPRRHR
jgi:hypothetical protein